MSMSDTIIELSIEEAIDLEDASFKSWIASATLEQIRDIKSLIRSQL